MAANRPVPSTVLSTGSVASEVSMLFRTKRVSEIRSIESKIRAEAEEKSEALRGLLGTRYKDLLQASDEMTAIRDASSDAVRDSLRSMAKNALQLRERFLEKNGQDATSPAVVTDDLERRKNVHVIGSKLKHIVDSPEVLYAHLESGDVYEAAVRYSLASCNYLELRNTPGLEGVANRFAQRRWKQVQIFKDQILAAAEKKLVTPGLESSVYSDVVASLIILSGKDRDILAVLDGMLASRTGWIDDENRDTTDAVSIRMRKVASILRESISCMADMFWASDDSGVERLLRDVDPGAADEVKLLRESGALKQSCVSWLDNVKAWLEDHGKDILVSADTSRILADTLRSIEEVFSERGWAEACEAALGQPSKFVFDIFTPFISDRAAAVASESVQRVVDKVLSDIEAAWGDIGTDAHTGKLVWAAISSQAVGWRTDTNHDNRESRENARSSPNEESEVARTLTCNGLVSAVVEGFESSLLEALRDVTILTHRDPTVSSAFDKSVRSSLPRVLEGLRSRLETIPLTFSDDSTKMGPSCELLIEQALFIARISSALGAAECVRSAYCFCEMEAEKTGQSPVASSNNGTRMNSGLEKFYSTASDVSAAGYQTWANRLCIRLKEQLLSELTNESVLNVSIGWASTDGTSSESRQLDSENAGGLRYPTTASTAAMKFVFRACGAANRAGGFALPASAIGYLRKEMSHAAVDSYRAAFDVYRNDIAVEGRNDIVKPKESDRSDVAIMQMLFDVLVLRQLLDDPANGTASPQSKSTLRGLEQQLHTAIDPIDLASCKKALHGSVSGYSSRTDILFGTITRNASGRSFLKRPLTTSTQLASSNLVSLCRTVPRFTYLPAPMPSTYSSIGGGTAGLSAKAALGALRSEATAVNGSAYRKRDADTSVAGYASKVSESVGRFGRGFFESLTRKVG